MATPAVMPTGTAPKDNGVDLDNFNDALRQSPAWRDFMVQHGQPVDGRPIKLSGGQRKQLKSLLSSTGVEFPKGIEVDPAGNINQDQGVSRWAHNKYVQIGLISAGALVTMGAAGFGPLAGVLGGGGAAGAGAGAGAAAGAAAGSGTASTIAGIGGAAAAGSASSWLRPLLQYGIPAATGIAGAAMAGHAESEAARLQNDYLNRALDAEKEDRDYTRGVAEEKKGYDRGQYADYLGRLSPYSGAGNAAVGRASSLLTTSRYQPQMAATPQGKGVQMRAPNGTISEVPETLIDHYQQLGAQRV